MDLTHSSHKNCDLVKVSGRIDTATSDRLEKMLKEIHDGGRYDVVLDMSEVEFMSSRGFWVLVETQKASKKGDKGLLVLAAVPDKIKESLELVGMSEYFTVYDDVVGAVGSF
ncbi:MAG: STAS domain-containing protein [Chloroflexi bacterium]|nr:STAS domain-containing protein [Chloroflexota bacterium]